MVFSNIYYYSFVLFAILLIGLHIFSIKYIQLKIQNHSDKKTIFLLILLSFILFIFSRYCIYQATKQIPIAILHMCLNLSVFITFTLSIFVIGDTYNIQLFIPGCLIVIYGLYLVNKSIIKK